MVTPTVSPCSPSSGVIEVTDGTESAAEAAGVVNGKAIAQRVISATEMANTFFI